jgi:precorrin-2 dehydrogenase/sirohydrochlorin ferrochelatase
VLKLKGKKVVVIGGGKVATRKVRTLLDVHAKVTVVSPTITTELKEWVALDRLSWKPKCFETKDISEAFLIIAATNQAEVNVDVYRSINPFQLINMVDRPDVSNFIVPSTLHRGKLVISASTSGASPGLSRKITQELSAIYDDTYEDYLNFLDSCRKKVLVEIDDPEVRNYIFKQLLDSVFLELTRSNSFHKRNESFLQLLRESK